MNHESLLIQLHTTNDNKNEAETTTEALIFQMPVE